MVWRTGREGFGKCVDVYFLILTGSDRGEPNAETAPYWKFVTLLLVLSPSVSVAVSSPVAGCETWMGFPCFLNVRTPTKAFRSEGKCTDFAGDGRGDEDGPGSDGFLSIRVVWLRGRGLWLLLWFGGVLEAVEYAPIEFERLSFRADFKGERVARLST